jgi:hypothetical protein
MAPEVQALLLAPDIPFPPNRGGRADVWRRAQALRETGCSVIVAYPGEPPSERAMAAADAHGISLLAFERQGTVSAIWSWVSTRGDMPLFMHRRMPTASAAQRLLPALRKAGVNVVVCEGPWLWNLGRVLSMELQCRLVYRSHNIEHRYMNRQAQLEKSLFRKALMWLSFAGLESYERHCIAQSHMLLDISADDLAYWGHPKGRWLPPLPVSTRNSHGQRQGGVVFVGNLRTPNNIAGVRLLLAEVLPRVRQACPSLPFFVVGSLPSEELEREIEKAGAVLRKDVAEPMEWMRGADCLVNPVMDGSGVQLKMLDMLQTDRPVVTFAQGVRGLPREVAGVVNVVANADEMARTIVRWADQGFPDVSDRRAVRTAFNARAFGVALMEAIAA